MTSKLDELAKALTGNEISDDVQSEETSLTVPDTKVFPRERKTKEKIISKMRGARIPLYEQGVSKFNAETTPGCKARFVNDDYPGKIQRYETAGWRIKYENGEPVIRITSRSGIKAYLMEIDKDIFEEDKKRKAYRRMEKLKDTVNLKKDKPADDNAYYGKVNLFEGDERK